MSPTWQLAERPMPQLPHHTPTHRTQASLVRDTPPSHTQRMARPHHRARPSPMPLLRPPGRHRVRPRPRLRQPAIPPTLQPCRWRQEGPQMNNPTRAAWLDRPVVCPMCGDVWTSVSSFSWWTAEAIGAPRTVCYGCVPWSPHDPAEEITTPTPWTRQPEALDDWTWNELNACLDLYTDVLTQYPAPDPLRPILLEVLDDLHDQVFPAGASTPSTPGEGQPPVLTCAPATPHPLQPIQVGELRPGPSVRTRPARSASPGITDHATSMHDHAEQLTFFELDQAPAPTPSTNLDRTSEADCMNMQSVAVGGGR